MSGYCALHGKTYFRTDGCPECRQIPSAPGILEHLRSIPVTPRYSFLVLATEIMIDAQI